MRTVDDVLRELAAELERRADQLTGETLAFMGDLLPAWMLEEPVRTQVWEFTRASCVAELGAMRAGGELPERLAPSDAAGAREGGEAGTPLALLTEGFRAGHRAQWNMLTEQVDAMALDPELARTVRRRASDFLFAYAARMSRLVTEEYLVARDHRLRSGEHHRLSAVRAVLDGEDTEGAELDYPVAGFHFALVGSGDALRERLPALARELDCRLLVLDVYPDPWWTWLGRTRPFTEAGRRLLAQLGVPGGCAVGIGTERSGAEGFRESQREAICAYRACGPERPVTTYPQVAIEDLASRDPEAARAFVASELEPIGGEDRRAHRLRETLAAYFASGNNARSTAARLGVHHQTVAQRLAAIEERIGGPVNQRRTELELALRLRRYLPEAERS